MFARQNIVLLEHQRMGLLFDDLVNTVVGVWYDELFWDIRRKDGMNSRKLVSISEKAMMEPSAHKS